MKKIFTLLFSTAIVFNATAQLLVEDFNYSGDLAANGWTIHSGTVDPITTTTGLTYTGYNGSGIGNAANVVGGGYDYNKGFVNQTGDGTTVWMSAMVRVTETAITAGDYFMHLGDRSDANPASFTSFSSRIFSKTSAGGVVNFGISNTSTATYGTTNFAINTTYLMVVKYTVNTSGNDEVLLWILSSGTPTSEAGLGSPEVSNTTTAGTDNIDAVALRQSSNPDVVVDGIRIGNTYGGSVLPLNLVTFNASYNGRASQLKWTTVQESNLKGFAVERSIDGITYNEFAFVPGVNNAGNTNYSYEDVNVNKGAVYYRLKIINNDGTFRYSQVFMINNKLSLQVQVFPNPASNTLTITHGKAGTRAMFRLVSIEGRQVKTQLTPAGSIQSAISIGELTRGNYQLVFENNGERTTTMFTKL